MTAANSKYDRYISSPEWRSLRLKVLERDQHCCQTCLSTDDLEVHHKTYVRLGNEDLEDLITLCSECHEAITTVIRRRRYSKRSIALVDINRRTPIAIIEVNPNAAKIEVSDHKRSTPSASQRTNGRSAKSLLENDETDQRQAEKDGR